MLAQAYQMKLSKIAKRLEFGSQMCRQTVEIHDVFEQADNRSKNVEIHDVFGAGNMENRDSVSN